jgi:arylsulfatase A-like enzyme
MARQATIGLLLALIAIGVVSLASTADRGHAMIAAAAAQRLPNFIIVYADDLGYADIGPFSTTQGAGRPLTPNLDRMAAEGIRLTNFYTAQAVCSASRMALLTGAYPNRVGIQGALNHTAAHGIHADEQTIAEVLKQRGYATGIFGKWHLGHHKRFLPVHHGFDEYFGLPYSNDMWPRHPQRKGFFPDLPLIEGDEIVGVDPDQSQLTRWYTERAVKFIEGHRDTPFFLYVPHTMPHVPLFASDTFKGRTAGGLYADVIAEIDWSVGKILDAVAQAKLDNDTLVIFTSDNGPWMSYGNHAGSPGSFRESKGTAFEGGVRVPFVARWPGRIPRGATGHLPAMTIDLLPTMAKLASAPVSPERVIDGRDMWPLLADARDAQPPHDALYFYWGSELHAVRSGRWKLHLPHPYQGLEKAGKDGVPGTYIARQIELSLFDLESDAGEKTNVADREPAVVKALLEYAERARHDLGDSLTKRTGANVRPAGKL